MMNFGFFYDFIYLPKYFEHNFFSDNNLLDLPFLFYVNSDIKRVVPKVKSTSPFALLTDFAWDFFSILPTAQTCFPVIFTCSHT
jgi:hypothetical protein